MGSASTLKCSSKIVKVLFAFVVLLLRAAYTMNRPVAVADSGTSRATNCTINVQSENGSDQFAPARREGGDTHVIARAAHTRPRKGHTRDIVALQSRTYKSMAVKRWGRSRCCSLPERVTLATGTCVSDTVIPTTHGPNGAHPATHGF